MTDFPYGLCCKVFVLFESHFVGLLALFLKSMLRVNTVDELIGLNLHNFFQIFCRSIE